MHPLTLPQFLLMILAIVLAAGMSLWAAAAAGLPLGVMAALALGAAGLLRLFARVE